MMRGLFIVGTDTDVGKTFQTGLLAKALRKQGLKLGCYKPVASGSAIDASNSDASLLAEACGVERNLLGRVCPQSFSAPLAPPVAAELEGKTVDEELLISGAHWWFGKCDLLLIEGAGGLMSPISQRLTVVDLAERFKFPLLLVVANRLGCVSQTLLAAEAIKSRSLRLAGIVLNTIPQGSEPTGSKSSNARVTLLETNLKLIEQFLPGVSIHPSSTSFAEECAV